MTNSQVAPDAQSLSYVRRPRWRPALIIGVSVLYFASARLGLSLAFEAEQVTAVWPPTGIALAATLLFGYRIWPGVALGAIAANAMTNAPWGTVFGIALGNTLEALAGAWLLRRFAQVDLALGRVRSVLGLGLLAALCSTTLSATIGTASLCLGGLKTWNYFGRLWQVWWLGDAVGDLIMAPLLLTWSMAWRRPPSGRRFIEAVVLVGLLMCGALSVFATATFGANSDPALVYFILPLVVWAALRFGQVGVSTVTFLAAGIAIWGTVRGVGPFAKQNPADSLNYLQLFMGVVSVTGLLLGSAVSESRAAEHRAKAQYAIARILTESRPMAETWNHMLRVICDYLRWDVGAVWLADLSNSELQLAAIWQASPGRAPAFESASRSHRFARGVGLPGRVWSTGKPLWVVNVIDDANFPRVDAATREGLRGAFAVPILAEGRVQGVAEFFSSEARTPDDRLLEAMAALGNQIGQFIVRRRAEEALARSEERYRSFIAQSTEGIWRFEAAEPIDADLPEETLVDAFYDRVTLAECNDALARMYGFESAKDIVGCRLDDYMPRSDPRNIDYLRAFIRAGFRLSEAESHEIDKDGMPRRFLNNLVGVVENGKLLRAWGTQRDVTVQRRSEEHQRILAEAGRVLGSSLEFDATLGTVCDLIAPAVADWCALDLLASDAELLRVQVAHRDPVKARIAREMQRLYPPQLETDEGLGHVIRTGQSLHVPEITDEMLQGFARDSEHLRLLRALELCDVLLVPLIARGRTLGVLTLAMAESGRRFDPQSIALAKELAYRAALAVDNSRLFRESQEALRGRDEALHQHKEMEEKLTLLVEASESLSESLEPKAVLSAILALSRQLINADAFAVWRYRTRDERWSIELAQGLSEEYQRATIVGAEATPILPDSPVVADDVQTNPMLHARSALHAREGIRSLMSIPLRVHGTTSGTLAFYYFMPHHFTAIEVRIGTALANLAGSAIGISELYQELRENDRRKDEFLAMLAHELRNPLSAIANAAQLARRSPLSDDVAWAHGVIDRQTSRLTHLIADLLDVSRITRGKVNIKKELLDVHVVIENAIDAVRPLLEEREHELTLAVAPDMPTIEADSTRLEQILINLLTNAAKYTRRGGHIHVSVQAQEGQIVLSVQDDGIGIAPEVLPTIFELFVQGERSIARSEGGLGIGLTLVRSLTELHGGSVNAQSAGQGKGSLFTVRLPINANRATD